MPDIKTADRLPPSIQVDVVEIGVRPRHEWVRCQIDRDLVFDTTGLEAYCLATWEPIVFDAFVVAAAVEYCDRMLNRPSLGWKRDIKLRIPVHDPEHWESSSVSTALHAALVLLTGDSWAITFKKRSKVVQKPRQGRLSMPDGPSVVIPFSDGLDSLAVAGLIAREHSEQAIPVRLGNKSMVPRQISNSDRPFASVPYRVSAGDSRFRESSARSRGFKFALLSGTAAYLSKASQIVMPESGQGALGSYLVPVGQAYEDYRNHPLFTRHMEDFLAALFRRKFQFLFPRLWFTKGETLSEFLDYAPGNVQWTKTRSCWQSSRHASVSGKRRQCGICAACLLRRLSVHAAGRTEDKETYVWERLNVCRFEDGSAPGFQKTNNWGALYEYSIAGVLHLDHLAELSGPGHHKAVIERKVFQLSRCLGNTEIDIQKKLDRLLAQHEREWSRFVHSLGADSFVAKWASRGL